MEQIISLGGSLIVPETIDLEFLKTFKQIIEENIKNDQFYIVAGGGKPARYYIEAAKSLFPELSEEDADKIGIQAGLLNSRLLLALFGKNAHPELITDYSQTFDSPIIINGRYKPGGSSDLIAVEIAEKRNIRRVINLTNTNGVYNRDPNKSEMAQKYEGISWADYCKLIGDLWQPGLNLPFDPVASRKARELGLEVVVANGRDLDNLEKILRGQKFKGTIIHH